MTKLIQTQDDREAAFEDWLADLYNVDPVAFETRVGEGWTEAQQRQQFIEEWTGQ
jgi:hypothetical protein